MNKTDLELMVGDQEQILWRGRPNFKCFLLESFFNSMLPIAVIWALVDGSMIGTIRMASAGAMAGGFGLAFLGFFLLHLMPVWIYLGGVLFSILKYKHTEFIITDKGVYISGGALTYNYEMKPFTDLSHINIHRGIFDQLLGVGDVIMVCAHTAYNTDTRNGHSDHDHEGFKIYDIPDYQKVFSMLKQLQTDIYSDTMYPNDMRPQENHGYQTKYRGMDQNRY